MIIGTIGFLDDYRGTPVHLRLILFFMCCFLSTSALNNNILFYIISQTSISYTNFDMGIFFKCIKLFRWR